MVERLERQYLPNIYKKINEGVLVRKVQWLLTVRVMVRLVKTHSSESEIELIFNKQYDVCFPKCVSFGKHTSLYMINTYHTYNMI